MSARRSAQQGFALILVLWILSLMTIMAGSFTLSMRRESAIIEGIKHNAETQSIAESGLALAQFMLLNPEAHSRWRADGSVYEIDFGHAKVRIRLLSEVGKIDINTANQKLLSALITNAPIEDEKARTKLLNAILDWRDADEVVREDGAEKDEYKQAKLSYTPRNKRFRSIEELQMVLGMNAEVFQWLTPLITVYSGQEVDVKLAAKDVLQVLPGLDAGKIDDYVMLRKQNNMNGLPTPDFPVNGAEVDENIVEPIEQVAAEGDVEAEVEIGAVELIAEVQIDDSVNTMVSVVVEQSDTGVGAPFKVLKWYRNYSGAESLFADEMSELLVGQYAEPQLNN
ncbi:MAG: type II secretion system protein GspK [Methylococcales bacterium]